MTSSGEDRDDCCSELNIAVRMEQSRLPVTWPTIAWEILRLLRKVLISSFTRLLSLLQSKAEPVTFIELSGFFLSSPSTPALNSLR